MFHRTSRYWLLGALLWADPAMAGATGPAPGSPGSPGSIDRLVAAYPQALERVDGNDLVWRDGTRMPIDDGTGAKSFDAWLSRPDLKDMLAEPYLAGQPATAPAPGRDPGRARNAAFFAKLYGDCSKGEVTPLLVDVAWLPRRGGRPVKITSRQGVDRRLAAVSARLDALPEAFDVYLLPPAGTYVCRPIAGTGRTSAHGYGIAIDIAVRRAHYWRWHSPKGRPIVWRNAIPPEIVAAFEAEGFIWGGRWHHYDTMHFEYRPELLSPPTPRIE